MHLPEPLPETDDLRHKALYSWLNRLRDYAQSITLMRSGGARLTRTPAGTLLTPTAQGVAGTASPIQTKMVQSVHDDYLTCTDGTLVALPPLFQKQCYDGLAIAQPDNTHTYAYVSPGYRTDSTPDPVSGTLTTHSFIYPPYLGGTGPGTNWSTILVASIPTGTGVFEIIAPSLVPQNLTLQDITPGRRWVNVNEICYGGYAAWQMMPSNPSSTEA